VSADTGNDMINKVASSGFTGYIEYPLTCEKIDKVIKAMFDQFSLKWIQNQFDNIGYSMNNIDCGLTNDSIVSGIPRIISAISGIEEDVSEESSSMD